jgi:hypothetical protein
MSQNNKPLQLAMRLDVGFYSNDLWAVERLLGQALNLDLVLQDDLELGGVYFDYEPWPVPDSGLCDVRLRQNYVAGTGWRVAHRPDLPIIAEINLRSTNLLEIGEVAAYLEATCGNQCAVCGYVVSLANLATEPSAEFWRAHWLDLPFSNSSSASTSIREPLLVYLALGIRAQTLTDAKELIEALLSVTLDANLDKYLAQDYLLAQPLTLLPGEKIMLGLRSNTLNQKTWVYPQHQDCNILMELTLSTFNLLTLGRLAASLEERCAVHGHECLSPIAYRVAGDLLCDLIPRLLKREFSSSEDAVSTWRLGHQRLQNDEWSIHSEEE